MSCVPFFRPVLILVSLAQAAASAEMPWIVVAPNKTSFAEEASGKPFVP